MIDTISHFGHQRVNGAPDAATARFLHELGEMVANATFSTRGQLWGALLDNKRKIDQECDYPPSGVPISVDLYKELYDREAVAARVVEVLPCETWQMTPAIIDRAAEAEGEDDPDRDDTPFEAAVKDLGKNLTPGGGPSWHDESEGSPLWEYCKRLDVLSGIGQFGIMLLGLDDAANLQDPVEGSTVVLTVNSADGPRTLVMPDSPMSDAEESYLSFLAAQDCTRNVWDGNDRKRDEFGRTLGVEPRFRQVAVPRLTDDERRVLDRWREEKIIANRIREAKETFDEMVANKDPGVAGKTFVDLLSGTDRQYFEAGSLGMGMAQTRTDGQPKPPGDSPNVLGPQGAPTAGIPFSPQEVGKGRRDTSPPQGTDQQYMGVQFGPSQAPADKASKKERKLLFVRVFDESLVQVVRYEWNVNNPRFGQPVMYRVTLNDPRKVYSGVGLPLATVFVHWSRVVHVPSDGGASTSEVFGTPRMQQMVNRCLDVRKVSAAGSEGYWQSCFAAISLETHPQAGGDVRIDYGGLQQMMTDFRNKLRRDLMLEGMAAKTLPPQVIDPSPFLTSLIEQICIKIPCPKRVFMGSERGELASSQDDAQWNDVIRGRQQLWVTPRIVVPLLNRLILLGVVPEPEDGYRVDWPDLDSLNDSQKAAVGLQVTQALAAYVAGGCEQVMPVEAFLVHVFGGLFAEEQVRAWVEAAEKKAEEDLADRQALADEHGFEPEAPEGFAKPEPEPPPQEPQPTTLRPGDTLVHPKTGATVAKGQPLPKPPFGGKTGIK